MTSTTTATTKALVISALPELTGLAERVNSNRIALCPSLTAGSQLLAPEVRLVVIGCDISTQEVLDAVPGLRARSPGLFVVWVGNRNDLADLPTLLRSVDTVLVFPDDIGLIDDVVQDTLQGTSRKPTRTARLRLAGQLLAGFGLLGLLWYLIVMLFALPPYLLPAPTVVARELGRALPSYLYHTGITALEAVLGFCIGNGIGFAAGIVLYRYTLLQQLSLPVFIGLQSIPIVAIAPLLIVWCGAGLVSKVAMATIICFFPMVVNTLQAFAGVDPDARDLFALYRASFPAMLRMLLMPAALPALVAALRISAGLAVVGAIVAELTGADRGLGYILLNASYRLETERLFAAMVLAAGLGGTFYMLPGLLLRRRLRGGLSS